MIANTQKSICKVVEENMSAKRSSAILIGWLVLLGALIGLVTAQEEIELPVPPGRLITVDGYQVHLFCVGEGSPTVIFEGGGGGINTLESWSLQEPISAYTRICVYDRSGEGWSEPRTEPRSWEQYTIELERILEAAEIESPYVMVGMSFGGPVARLFAMRNPDQVVGVVLIDGIVPGFERQALERIPAYREGMEGFMGFLRSMLDGVEAGTWTPADAAQLAPPITLPGYEDQQAYISILMQPSFSRAVIEAFTMVREDEGEGFTEPHALGDIPLIVFAHGGEYGLPLQGEDLVTFETMWREAQETQAASSTNGVLVIPQGTSHRLFDERPDLVLGMIRTLVESSRDEG